MMPTKIGQNEFYDLDYLRHKNPTFFGKCFDVQKIIAKHAIPDQDYMFVSRTKTGYAPLPRDSRFRGKKLLISEAWARRHVLEPAAASSSSSAETSLAPLAPGILVNMSFDAAALSRVLPVYGHKRHPDAVFFKDKDVEHVFATTPPTLQNTLGFQEKIHHVYFRYGNPAQTTLFFTYKGVLRLLVIHQHPLLDTFIEKTRQELFVDISRTLSPKKNEVYKLTLDIVQSLMHTNVHAMPVVYLLELGVAKDLRDRMKIPPHIPDDVYIFKYGLTVDAQRRFKEHENTFSKMGITPTLKYHTYIDPINLSKAEKDIKDFFEGSDWKVPHKQTEIGFVPPKLVHLAENLFRQIGKEYAGKIHTMQQELENYKSALHDHIKKIDALHAHYDQIIHLKDVHHAREMDMLQQALQQQKEHGAREIELKDHILDLKDELLYEFKSRQKK